MNALSTRRARHRADRGHHRACPAYGSFRSEQRPARSYHELGLVRFDHGRHCAVPDRYRTGSGSRIRRHEVRVRTHTEHGNWPIRHHPLPADGGAIGNRHHGLPGCTHTDRRQRPMRDCSHPADRGLDHRERTLAHGTGGRGPLRIRYRSQSGENSRDGEPRHPRPRTYGPGRNPHRSHAPGHGPRRGRHRAQTRRSRLHRITAIVFGWLLIPVLSATHADTSTGGLHRPPDVRQPVTRRYDEPTRPHPGGFGWPLRPRPPVVRRFDIPPHDWLPGHRGVDLGGVARQPVLASGNGVVAFEGEVAGKPVVSVDHPGGLRTTYEPVRASVPVGHRVVRGEVLGALEPGHPGCSTACLHWGLRRGREYLDPLGLIHFAPLRLKPVRPDG